MKKYWIFGWIVFMFVSCSSTFAWTKEDILKTTKTTQQYITEMDGLAVNGIERIEVDMGDGSEPFMITSGIPADYELLAPQRKDATFQGWKFDDGKTYPAGTSFYVKISEPHVTSTTLTAQWEKVTEVKEKYIVECSANEGGKVLYNNREVQNTKLEFEELDYPSFTIVPNTGYEVEKAYVDGKEVQLNIPINKTTGEHGYPMWDFPNIDSNHTFKVVFQKIREETVVGIVSEWARESVFEAQQKDLIPSEYFGTDYTQNITRLEFANSCVKLYEALKNEKILLSQYPEFEYSPFTDVNNTGVVIAYNLGITNGVGAKMFDPNSHITREQMATMLTRTIEKADLKNTYQGTTKFVDESTISDWALESVRYMSAIGLINGMGNNLFVPEGTATREQTLTICVRAVNQF